MDATMNFFDGWINDPEDKDKPELAYYAESSREPLTAENYTEEDAAVLSNLAYVKFEKDESIMNGTYNSHMTVKQYAREMMQYTSNADEVAFLKSVANSQRYANCEIGDFKSTYSHYTNDADIQKYDSQFAAFTVKVGDDKIVAMRGTDGNASAWREDFNLLNEDAKGTQSQRDAAEYVKHTAEGMEGSDGHIMIAGHSKGGNNAVSSYIMNGSDVRNRVSRIDNLDGPGFNETMQQAYKDGYSELGDKLHNTYPKDSLIGQLLNNNPGSNKFVDSNVRDSFEKAGIGGEHDLNSWQLSGDGRNGTASHFVEKKKGTFADVLDRGLDDTVHNMSYKERQDLYNAINAMKVPEAIGGTADAKDVLNGFVHMSAEQQKLVGTTLLAIAANSTGEYIGDVKAYWADKGEKVKKFCDDAAKKMEKLAKKAKDGMKDLWNQAREQVKAIGKKAKHYADKLGKGAKDLWKKAGSLVDKTTGKTAHGATGSTAAYCNFRVDAGRLGNTIGEMDAIEGKIKDSNRQLTRIMSQVDRRMLMDCMDAVKEVQKDLQNESTACDDLGEALRKIKSLYETSEMNLAGQA